MSTLKLTITLALPLALSPALAGQTVEAPHLGKAMTPQDVSKWNITIFPDGTGLPPGHGTAKEGRALYVQKCASCHGSEGQGATAEELIGEPKPPTIERPDKAIGPYWPYATTIFDFIRRSMPPDAPDTLSDDQVYALTAYLLAADKVIADDYEINAHTLPKVKMPNRDGFIWIDAKKKPR